MKKVYRAEVSWTVSAVMEVEAESMEEALAIIDDAALPTESEYCDDSFSVDLIEKIGEVEDDEDLSEIKTPRLSIDGYGYTVEGEVLRFNLLNDFSQYKEQVLKEDESDQYYPDGYCAEVGYSGHYRLETAELYYIGDNKFISIRSMTEDELAQLQTFLENELILGKEIKPW